MKTQNTRKALMIAFASALALLSWQALAQDDTSATLAPQLPYGATQILQLEQAKVSDGTIIAYIENSGNRDHLDAGQILYLRQQGVSEAVLTAMLTGPKAGGATTTTSTSTPESAVPTPSASTPTTPQVAVRPAVTYVQTVPAAYYYAPYYYPPYRYYAWPRPVVGVGWGRWSGWHVGVAW